MGLRDQQIYRLLKGNAPSVISTAHRLSVGVEMAVYGSAPASAAWPAANRALFIPFYLPSNAIVQHLVVRNGATASGNFDIGIYNLNLTKIVSSGTQAQGTVDTNQVINVTDTSMKAGMYFLALVFDNITATVFQASAGRDWNSGVFRQNSAFPLPATATPSGTEPTTAISVPIMSAFFRNYF